MEYDQFVANKRRAEIATGHAPGALNSNLFDFQQAIVACAVRMGRRFIGTELKPQYFDLACQNLAEASGAQQADLWT